jgi:hypothetical protein
MKGDYFEGGGPPLGPKLLFDQMAAPDPEIVDGSLYTITERFRVAVYSSTSYQHHFSSSST